jgi:hypothetical protein
MGGTPPHATVTIDDEPVGTLSHVASRGVALPPGRHRISVEAPGYFPWDREVDAKSAPVRLSVTLAPLPE